MRNIGFCDFQTLILDNMLLQQLLEIHGNFDYRSILVDSGIIVHWKVSSRFSQFFCACLLLSSITCTMCNLFLVQPRIFSRLSVFLCASYSAQRLSHCWWCTERSYSSLPHRYPLQPVKTFEMPFKVRWCAKEDHFIQLAGQGAPADSLCWSHLAGKIRLQ